MTTTSSIRRTLAAALAAGLVLAAAPSAHAGDTAAARAQLEAGYALKEQGKYAEAIPHLEESLRLDPQLKTMANLADCEEHTGKLADAQRHWLMARDRAAAEGNDKFKGAAEARLAALEAELPKLTIKLAEGAPPGTQVVRDGTVLGSISLGTPLPTDIGTHTIVARAPGFADQTFTVTLAEKEQKEIAVAPGAAVPAAVAAPAVVTEPQESPVPFWTMNRKAAIAAGSVGVVGLALGIGFGVTAGSKWSTAEAECGSGCASSSPAQSERSTALTFATVSDVTFVVAGVAVASGVVLWLTSPKPHEARRPIDALRVVPAFGRDEGGLVAAGSF